MKRRWGQRCAVYSVLAETARDRKTGSSVRAQAFVMLGMPPRMQTTAPSGAPPESEHSECNADTVPRIDDEGD